MEGAARNNLAECLRRLRRYAAARVEAERGIELTREFGHAAELWTTWAILSDIEHDLGNTEAAVTARKQAINTYAAYRRDGGYPREATGRFTTKRTAALASGASTRQLVSQLETPPGAAANVAAFFDGLRAILSGGRDPALLANPGLDYRDVAELTLLLASLSSPDRSDQA
jgi:hypothetical protein